MRDGYHEYPDHCKTICTQRLGYLCVMDQGDRATRLKLARERAGHESPRAAAKHNRWNENTYKAREGGLRDYGVEDAQEFGRAFDVSWVWLVSGQGEIARQNSVRLSGLIGAGGEVDTNFRQAYEEDVVEIEVLIPLPPDITAYEVWGDSMLPKYEPGDIVLVRGSYIDPWDYIDKIVLVMLTDGKRYLKKLRKGDEEDRFNLESFNAAIMKNVKVASVGVIHLTVSADQVLRLSGAKEVSRRYKKSDSRS